MNLDARLKIKSPQVVHETIDGETILLNLDSGTYYSLNDAGGALWGLIEDSCSIRDIIQALSRHYNNEQETVETGIRAFFDELIEEGLVEEAAAPGEPHDKDNPIRIFSQLEDKTTAFSAPVLNKYTDMQDLLLLDPIHDVDDTGWPSAKA